MSDEKDTKKIVAVTDDSSDIKKKDSDIVLETKKVDKKESISKKSVIDEKQSKQSKYFRTAKGKRRTIKQVPRGRAYIQASVNNTIITITDQNGNVLTWSSAGNCGFKGPKKATPYAAGKVVEKVAAKAEQYGVKELSVFVTGIGSGRDSAVRSLNSQGFNVISIKETTPVPHNGCRARRARRI